MLHVTSRRNLSTVSFDKIGEEPETRDERQREIKKAKETEMLQKKVRFNYIKIDIQLIFPTKLAKNN